MKKMQNIPVSELESMHKYYAEKMMKASNELQKARGEYEKLSLEYKMLPYSGMTENEKELRKRQLWELIGRAIGACEVASASLTAYDEAAESLDYLVKYDLYQAL